MQEGACCPDHSLMGRVLTAGEYFAAFPVTVFRHSLHTLCNPFSSLASKELPAWFQTLGVYKVSFNGMVVQKPKHVQSLSRQCGGSFLKDKSTVAKESDSAIVLTTKDCTATFFRQQKPESKSDAF